MSGIGVSNGVPLKEQLEARFKCPNNPTKHRYPTRAEADIAAAERTITAGMRIVSYACTGCGSFHLSKHTGERDAIDRHRANEAKRNRKTYPTRAFTPPEPSTEPEHVTIVMPRAEYRGKMNPPDAVTRKRLQTTKDTPARRKRLAEWAAGDMPERITGGDWQKRENINPGTARADLLAVLETVPGTRGAGTRYRRRTTDTAAPEIATEEFPTLPETSSLEPASAPAAVAAAESPAPAAPEAPADAADAPQTVDQEAKAPKAHGVHKRAAERRVITVAHNDLPDETTLGDLRRTYAAIGGHIRIEVLL